MDLMAEAAHERSDLLALLQDLSPAEWRTPSLCDGWTVRDVVAHVLSYEGVPLTRIVARAVQGRLTFGGVNARVLSDLADATPEELVERLRRYPRPTGLTEARGGAVGLVDGLIHQQDVRRPLDRPRSIPAERLRFALGFALFAPPLRGAWTARGVRLVAEDVDWTHGRGPEARGPAEAVLMAMAGRRGAADELTGPGSDVLRGRNA